MRACILYGGTTLKLQTELRLKFSVTGTDFYQSQWDSGISGQDSTVLALAFTIISNWHVDVAKTKEALDIAPLPIALTIIFDFGSAVIGIGIENDLQSG